MHQYVSLNWSKPDVNLVASARIIRAGGLGFDSRAGQIGTVSPPARPRCDVSSELCCPGAMPRRWIPSIVTRFDV